MKIARIEPILIRVPYRHGGPHPRIGGRAWTTMDTLLLRVETDHGVVGWGEAFGYNAIPATRTALESAIVPLCLGRPVQPIEALMEELQRKLHNFGRGGPPIFALSGIEIALWDIAGQVAGVPLHRLLGEGGRERVPAYASLLRYGDAALVARNAAEAVARGYRHVKLHEIGEEEIAAGREAVGEEIALMVDANCPWPAAEAAARARRLARLDLHWLEEPVWPPEDYAGLARVARESGVPVAAGENANTPADFVAMLEAGAVSYAQPSVTKIGGLSGLKSVAAIAEARGVALAPHSPYFGPGLLATIHFIAASRGAMICERFYCDLEASPFGAAVDAVDGSMAVPQAPGLGVPVDETAIARYRAD